MKVVENVRESIAMDKKIATKPKLIAYYITFAIAADRICLWVYGNGAIDNLV